MYARWVNELIPYIQRIVPKDTGELLGSILLSVSTPELKSDRLIIRIGADVPYAKYVQKMRSTYRPNAGPAVRHGPGMGPDYRNVSSRTGNRLHDPYASHDFMFLITKKSEDIMEEVISDVLAEFVDDDLFYMLKQYIIGFSRRKSLIRYSLGRT
jgi:hypothetical protein